MFSSYRPVIIRMMKTGLLIDIGIFISAFIISQLIDWRTNQEYGTMLHILAGLGVVMGTLSISGSWQGRNQFGYQYARTAGGEKPHHRARRDLDDSLESFGFFLQMLVAAILPLLVGMLLQSS